MRGIWGATAAAAAMLSAGAAEAQRRAVPTADARFCADLRRTLEAGGFEEGFRHLERSRAAPPWFGFHPGSCRASGPSAAGRWQWRCYQNLAPEHLSLETLAASVAACIPEAKREADGDRRHAVFTHEGARISIDERGGPRAKVGRIVTFFVEVESPR